MFECPAQSTAEPVADIDVAIDKVRLFRLERMDDGVIWIRLYREGGDDKVIWLNSSSAISAIVEEDKDEPLAQSDAEPVGWQYREPGGEWVTGDAATDIYYRTHKYEIRRLYAAPPRPAVSAGLIEAERILKRCRTVLANMALENEGGGIFTARWPIHHEPLRGDAKRLLPIIDEVLRARAADRSVHGELIPDCPTDGVAARQGNGG